MTSKRLYRKPNEGKVAGVSAGLSDYLDIDVTIIRIAFVAGLLATGGFILIIYIIMAIIMPRYPLKGGSPKATTSISENIQSLSEEIKDTTSAERLRNYFGVGLVLFGTWLLAVRFLPQLGNFNWEFIWPVILIVIGFMIVINRKG